MIQDLRVLMSKVNRMACDKGWWDGDDRSFGDFIALVTTELSEAFEEYRNSKPMGLIYHGGPDGLKPEGIPVELADAVIRILDWCEHFNIPLIEAINEKMAYNATRPYRHGGKVA